MIMAKFEEKITINGDVTICEVQNLETGEVFFGKATRQECDKNDYNLSVSTYVEQEDTREVIDITELNKEIARIVEREAQLRTEIDKIVAEIEVGA